MERPWVDYSAAFILREMTGELVVTLGPGLCVGWRCAMKPVNNCHVISDIVEGQNFSGIRIHTEGGQSCIRLNLNWKCQCELMTSQAEMAVPACRLPSQLYFPQCKPGSWRNGCFSYICQKSAKWAQTFLASGTKTAVSPSLQYEAFVMSPWANSVPAGVAAWWRQRILDYSRQSYFQDSYLVFEGESDLIIWNMSRKDNLSIYPFFFYLSYHRETKEQMRVLQAV